MFLVVGDKVYSPNAQPIMVVLSQEDKKNIANMAPEACCYCSYMDEKHSAEEVQEWMDKMVHEIFKSSVVKTEEIVEESEETAEEENQEEADEIIEDEQVEEESNEGEGSEDILMKDNQTPVVTDITFTSAIFFTGEKYDVTAIADDPEGDELIFDVEGNVNIDVDIDVEGIVSLYPEEGWFGIEYIIFPSIIFT